MDLSGEYRIPASRDAVWAALNDPDVLRQAINGIESLDKVSDTEFTATVQAKVGPVKAKFSGKVTLSNLDPPNGYTISGEGQGGVAGFAKGGADVSLAEDGTDTVLTYTANAQVGGKLAQVGSRLVAGTAKKMADEFFSKFAELVAAQAPAEEPVEGEPAPTSPAEAPAAESSPSTGVPPLYWILGVVAAVVILLLIFS